MPRRPDRHGTCPICLGVRRLTFHHLICRTVHKNKWFKKRFSREQMGTGVYLCRRCHSSIHRLIPDEKEMSREFNSLDKLLAHPKVAGYARWARGRIDGTDSEEEEADGWIERH